MTNDPSNSTAYINPYKQFRGFVVPNWLARRQEVSHGAKLCYGRLMQFNGRGTRCNPRESVLARELAVSERTCRRFLFELRDNGLIEIHHRGLRRANSYTFLQHPWMVDFLDTNDRSPRPSSSGPEQPQLSGPLVLEIESLRRESPEESPYSPRNGDSVGSPTDRLSVQVEEILSVYPVQTGRIGAARHVKQAIRECGYDHVLQKTHAYAECVRPTDQRYIPYPTKFFRERRFNDPPETWTRCQSRKSETHVTRPDDYPGGITTL